MGLLRTLRGSLAVPTPQAAAPAASSHVSGLSPASRPIYDRAAEGTGIFVKHIEDGVCPWQQLKAGHLSGLERATWHALPRIQCDRPRYERV